MMGLALGVVIVISFFISRVSFFVGVSIEKYDERGSENLSYEVFKVQ